MTNPETRLRWGRIGFHEPKVRELCAAAGFSSVRRVEMENPFNSLYEIRP